MKGKTFLILGETVNGRSLGIGVVLTSFLGLGVYGGTFKLGALLGFAPQTRVATALGLALLAIVAVAFIVNIYLGTRREVNEDVPSNSDLRGVLSGFDTDANEELKNLNAGPNDVLRIADETGITKQLEQIALADGASSNTERMV